MKAKNWILSAMLIVSLFSNASAQSDIMWQWEYAGVNGRHDMINSSLQLADGSIISAGGVNISTTEAAGIGVLMKHSSEGELLWMHEYDQTGLQMFSDVDSTADGGYILAGESDYHGWILKVDSDGDMLWNHTYSAGGIAYYTNKIMEASDQSIMMCGTVTYGTDDTRMWVKRFDSEGNDILDTTYAYQDSRTWGNGIVETADGDFILAGTMAPSGSDYTSPYLVKINTQGDTLWTKNCEGDGILISLTKSIEITDDQQLIVAADYVPTSQLPRTGLRMLVLDENHEIQLDRRFYHTYFDNYAYRAFETTEGGFVMVGHSTVEEGENLMTKAYIVRMDDVGDTLATKIYGEYGYQIVPGSGFQANDGNIVFGGYTSEGMYGDSDMALMKIIDYAYPSIQVSTSEIDFGSVDLDDFGYENLTIRNNGYVPLVIDSITLNEPFSHSFELPITLDHGESVHEYVIFHPLETGTFDETLTIVSNALGGDLTISVTGIGNSTSDVSDREGLPNTFALGMAYPNPFNSEVAFSVAVPLGKKALLSIFNISGQTVDKITFEGNGTSSLYHWRPINLSSGVYFMNLGLVDSQEMISQKILYLR